MNPSEVAESDTTSCAWGHGGVTPWGVPGVAIDQFGGSMTLIVPGFDAAGRDDRDRTSCRR